MRQADGQEADDRADAGIVCGQCITERRLLSGGRQEDPRSPTDTRHVELGVQTAALRYRRRAIRPGTAQRDSGFGLLLQRTIQCD